MILFHSSILPTLSSVSGLIYVYERIMAIVICSECLCTQKHFEQFICKEAFYESWISEISSLHA